MTLQSGSQNAACIRITPVLVKQQMAGSHPQDFRFTRSGKGLDILSSSKVPSDAGATGLANTLGDPLIQVQPLF